MRKLAPLLMSLMLALACGPPSSDLASPAAARDTDVAVEEVLDAVAGAGTITPPTIDQQTRRRIARTGLTALDRERASPGFTLYSPMYGAGTVYLIDVEGREVHRWELDSPPGLCGYLLPNGNLFYMGKARDVTWDLFPGWNAWKGGVMMEVDWDGNVVWEHRDPNQHHDARRTPEGGAVYLAIERVPDHIARRVKGGIPGSESNGMWADVIVEVDSTGQRVWEWHAYQHLDPETDVITFNDRRDEWTHGNTVAPLPGGRIMVSFRNISMVAIIDKASGEFVWKTRYGMLAQQHDPSLLLDGNILVFDNGAHRSDSSRTESRVIEVDPRTNEIVWEYRDSPGHNFFSSFISGARRLPNGNTLITEGDFGRMFQVTPGGEVVWEFINPHFHGPPGAQSNAVFRATHYLSEDIPALRD